MAALSRTCTQQRPDTRTLAAESEELNCHSPAFLSLLGRRTPLPVSLHAGRRRPVADSEGLTHCGPEFLGLQRRRMLLTLRCDPDTRTLAAESEGLTCHSPGQSEATPRVYGPFGTGSPERAIYTRIAGEDASNTPTRDIGPC